MAAVTRRNRRAPDMIRSDAARPEPVLGSTDIDIKLRYCSTSRVQEFLGLVHPSRNLKWSSSRKELPLLQSRSVVRLVTETESEAALYMRPRGRPRKSAP